MPRSLSTGEEVDNAHGPAPAQLPRKQSGNGQNGVKPTGLKAVWLRGGLSPRCSPTSALGQEKKEELT